MWRLSHNVKIFIRNQEEEHKHKICCRTKNTNYNIQIRQIMAEVRVEQEKCVREILDKFVEMYQ